MFADRAEVSPVIVAASWAAPPEDLRLGDRDVHVWKASLDVGPLCVGRFAEILSEDERARALRFVFAPDRDRFITCRGILRALLGRYLRVAPDSLRFTYNAYGKPVLSTGCGREAYRFNVSHVQGMALYGVTIGREIGIDVERVRPDVVSDQIADQCFSRRELAAFRGLSPAGRVEGFFRGWTRKEAFVKARGEGFAYPLGEFDVSLGPTESAALLSTPRDPLETSRWSLEEVLAGPDYIAAIAVEGRGWRLRRWQWTDS
jgi:4'-phosphopantetheinyl transferase